MLKLGDVPDSLSGSGYCHFCLISGSWCEKNPAKLKKGPDPNRDPADSDLVSKTEHTEKCFFKDKPCVN